MKQLILPIRKIEPITFIGIALAFISPIYPLMATVCTFIIADAMLEVINSFKNHQFCPTFVKKLIIFGKEIRNEIKDGQDNS